MLVEKPVPLPGGITWLKSTGDTVGRFDSSGYAVLSWDDKVWLSFCTGMCLPVTLQHSDHILTQLPWSCLESRTYKLMFKLKVTYTGVRPFPVVHHAPIPRSKANQPPGFEKWRHILILTKPEKKIDRYQCVRHVLQVGSFSGPKGESMRLSSRNPTAPHYLKEKGVSRRLDIAPEASSKLVNSQ